MNQIRHRRVRTPRFHPRGAAMDFTILLKHLEQSETVVALSQLHIERQRQIVAQCDGQDSGRLKNLLRVFEEMLATHLGRRDLLRDRLPFGGGECVILALWTGPCSKIIWHRPSATS
jgi:hypothetical protein